MLKSRGIGHLIWNTYRTNDFPVSCLMNKVIVEEDNYHCSDVKVVIIYPESSSNDENIKREVCEIMISALHNQLPA